jgi:hypothetical protein
MTVETPTTNFTWSNDILNEEYSSTEPQRQLVKQLNVLQQVVVRCAAQENDVNFINTLVNIVNAMQSWST